MQQINYGLLAASGIQARPLSDAQRAQLTQYIAQKQKALKSSRLSGVGDDDGIDWQSFLSSLPSQVAKVWTTYTNAQLQSQLMEVNIQRAAAGQPLIKMPGGLSFGVDDGTKTVMIAVAAIVAGAILFGKRR